MPCYKPPDKGNIEMSTLGLGTSEYLTSRYDTWVTIRPYDKYGYIAHFKTSNVL